MVLKNKLVEGLENFLQNVAVGEEIPRTIDSGLDLVQFRGGLLDRIKGIASKEGNPSYQVGRKVFEFDSKLGLSGQKLDSLRYYRGLMDGLDESSHPKDASASYLDGYALGHQLF